MRFGEDGEEVRKKMEKRLEEKIKEIGSLEKYLEQFEELLKECCERQEVSTNLS